MSAYVALDAVPTITSPSINSPSITPTVKIFVSLSHFLTLDVVWDACPLTVSLKEYVPIPVINGGSAISIDGSSVYP